MNVILSIHPKWAKLIYEGKKTLEWRKNTPNADFIDKVFLYETAPVRKVTGFFMYDHYYSMVFSVTKDGKPRDGADVLLDRGCVPLDELKNTQVAIKRFLAGNSTKSASSTLRNRLLTSA